MNDDPSTLPVAGLVAAATRGATEPLAELVIRFLPDLRAHVDRQLGPALQRREADADIVQSACREALATLRDGGFEYRGDEAFRAWLFQVALNKVRERARYHGAEHRRAVTPMDPDATALAAAIATDPSPSQAALDREAHQRLLDAFGRLDTSMRDIVRWAHFEQLSHKEIAARLGTTEGNSRVLLARALSRLALLAAREPPGS